MSTALSDLATVQKARMSDDLSNLLTCIKVIIIAIVIAASLVVVVHGITRVHIYCIKPLLSASGHLAEHTPTADHAQDHARTHDSYSINTLTTPTGPALLLRSIVITANHAHGPPYLHDDVSDTSAPDDGHAHEIRTV